MTNFFSLIPIAFRLFSHREQIIQLIHRLTPVIQDVVKIIPVVTPVVNEVEKAIKDVTPTVQQLIHEIYPDWDRYVVQALPPPVMDIKWVQTQLNKIMGTDIEVDGDFGNETKELTKKFQAKYMDADDVDGYPGVKTCAKLLELGRK